MFDLLARLAYEPEGATCAPIPWPDGLAPRPIATSGAPTDPLPQADVLVVTWTSAEWQALADVLTPGVDKAAWQPYAEHWDEYESQLTWKSPAKDARCMAEYQLTMIGTKRVLCVHSQLHLATDAVSAPIVQLWGQMVAEVQPALVITTGTAGGIGAETVLGDVFVVNAAKFNCTKAFAHKPWAQERFAQPGGLAIGPHMQVANEELLPVNAQRLPETLTPRPPVIWASTGDVETVDYFGFADTDDSYGIVADDPTAHTEEMDDATLPLALSAIPSAPRWLSIRNASDPQVPSSLGSLEAQSQWASQIYERYGFYTTIGSAIACWAVIADLDTGSATARAPGRRGVRESHAPHLALSRFRTAAPPTPPPSGDVTMGLTDWGMLGNGPTPDNPHEHPTGVGDCGVAGTEHGRMCKALVSVTDGVPVYEAGFAVPTTRYSTSLYFRYGRAQGEAGVEPDQGVTNATWLHWLYSGGLVDWYGELDTRDPDEIHAVMLACRGVLVATALNPQAETQFAAGEPWSVGPGDEATPDEGHDILLVAYDPDGETFISWGRPQRATVDWAAACVTDIWAFGTREDAERAGYTFAAIKTAIDAAGGTVSGDSP